MTTKPQSTTEPSTDDRDRLVKTFAYEWVCFNHDVGDKYPYLVTDVTDDCMLELEGMSGLFASTCFHRVPAPPTPSADGRYCTHHDDDPAHGKECYVTAAASAVAPVEQARYEKAHDARYQMTHSVHPDIVVLWFLALKSHWFDDPNNMFYGQREQAKAYLYKWVETGELADDNTTLEIATAMKFREWLSSSWTTSESSYSEGVDDAARVARKAAARAIANALERDEVPHHIEESEPFIAAIIERCVSEVRET